MTPERIAELRKLCEAATPGPMVVSVLIDPEMWAMGVQGGNAWLSEFRKFEDAKFYAAARTALPEALDEIDSLRKLLIEAELAIMNQRGDSSRNTQRCYCACHSPFSSRPICLHCRPEAFTDTRDPYCETEEEFAVRIARGGAK